MFIKEMSDYEMGWQDFIAGLDPIPDPQDTAEDMQYMLGYNEAKDASLAGRIFPCK